MKFTCDRVSQSSIFFVEIEHNSGSFHSFRYNSDDQEATVAEIGAENGALVEYDQLLFVIEPI